MEKKRLFLASPHMSDEGYEKFFVKDAFDKNWIAPLGENVDSFEREIREMVNIENAVALISGTASIHLALRAAGVGEGDEVFCQSLTFSASANPILYEKAKPIFVDSNRETWNMCPKALEEAIKAHPKAKAVVAVHLYGMCFQIDEIREICKKNNLVLIEDAAESLGTTYKGQYTGTFGDYGIYSFNGNKIITTSGGGMLVTKNKQKADKIRFWSTQSKEPRKYYYHKELGFNYRLSNISAGIGRGQLKVLEQRIEKKRAIFAYYKEHLADLPGISFMPEMEGTRMNCWLSCILSEEISPETIADQLEKENIETRPIWKPMHQQPFFEAYPFYGEGISDEIFAKGLCLPSDTKMTEEDLKRVVETIRSLW